ncbi:MAG: hypothetical protein ABJA81_06970 [Nocardioidaceae bacterium]
MTNEKPLPEPYLSLVRTIAANAPDMGGANRAAVAELEARLALAQNRVAKSLNYATWVLVVATVVLGIVTIRAA